MRSICSQVLGLLFISSSAFSAPLTVQTAVQTAMQNSPELQRAESAKEEVSWKRVEATSTYLPTLTGGILHYTDKKDMIADVQFPGSSSIISFPEISPWSIYSLSAQYMIFDGFAGTARYNASKAFERGANKDFEWSRFQITRQVQVQFFKTLGYKLLQEVAEQNLKTLQDHLRDVNLFKRAGVSTNYDVLRVEVQVSEARTELMNAEDSIEVAKGQLGQVLGVTDPQDVTGSLPTLDPDALKSLKNEKVETRPDLLALQEKSQALDELQTATSRHWSPKVALVGTYQYYNNSTERFDEWDKFRDAYQVGVNLTWNFFDGFADVAKNHQTLEQKIQSEKSLQLARLKANQDLGFWKKKYAYYCTIYKARLEDVQKSKESVRLAREGRRVGARTNTDLLDAESDFNRSQAGAVLAQLGAIEALINLELATGQELSHFTN